VDTAHLVAVPSARLINNSKFYTAPNFPLQGAYTLKLEEVGYFGRFFQLNLRFTSARKFAAILNISFVKVVMAALARGRLLRLDCSKSTSIS
jgi:hypothetical protein